MAGHSKWANIKRRKGDQDARRGSIWTKVSREITVATRIAGKDGNPRLRDAIALAKTHNMPKDTIQRAILRGAGELEGLEYEEITYEGYGPGGAAIFIETTTDNKNRTIADLRNIFSRHGGNMGENGSVSWMFTKKGFLEIDKKNIEEEELFEIAIDLGADGFQSTQNTYSITCEPNKLSNLREGLEKKYEISRFEMIAEPSTTVDMEKEVVEKILKLLESLEDHDDVQRVHTNANFPDS